MKEEKTLSEKIWETESWSVKDQEMIVSKCIDVKDVKQFIKEILKMFEDRESYEIIYKKIKQKSGRELVE